tara:strand:+ start:137 stop:1747 length:1611 start_codon:yes stop_codon:yes gene_type:complete
VEIDGLVVEGLTDGIWTPIVDGVRLTLSKGEVLGIIGESGAGKSTLGLSALGYTKPGCRIRSGTVKFDGQELTTMSEPELRELRGVRFSYVAQSAAAAFNPAHRIIDQVIESAVQHQQLTARDATIRSEELFEQLELPDSKHFGSRYPHQVSGGQLQRAMTAMAMGCHPDLVVFDEPTTALDVTTQIEVLGAIKHAVHARSSAAIYITHDLAVVAQIADRIMVLRNGCLVEQGDTRSLLKNPTREYTKQLLSVRTLHKKPTIAKIGGSVLEARNITARYPGTSNNVLENVSIQVKKGTTVAIVGESGSGKSTFARVITGLLMPETGEIRYEGKVLPPAIGDRSKEQLRRIQMIYQMPDVALNPRQRVQDIIGRPLEFYLRMKGKAKFDRVTELLNQIELPEEFRDRYPGQLSGGEKQRICIARALAAQPAVIICDEVTSALDQLVAEGILELLQRIQRALEVSYLFITHDLATVKAIADDIVVMFEGAVVEQGPKDVILSPPHAAYTELLLTSIPEMDPDWLSKLIKGRRQAASIE